MNSAVSNGGFLLVFKKLAAPTSCWTDASKYQLACQTVSIAMKAVWNKIHRCIGAMADVNCNCNMVKFNRGLRIDPSPKFF